jgi:hypothetical protein
LPDLLQQMSVPSALYLVLIASHFGGLIRKNCVINAQRSHCPEVGKPNQVSS